MIALLPIAISFLKLIKVKNFNFSKSERDPRSRISIIQSKIAIGSGGLFGKGFLNGSKVTRLSTEKHTTSLHSFPKNLGFLDHYLFCSYMH